MRCLKPCFLSSHGIRGRSETRFDNSVSRPDPHVVTVGPVGRLGPRRFGALCASAFFSAVFPSRRPFAACLHITSLTGLFRAFRAASCSAHRIRYGLHAAQTGFLLTGHSGYFPARCLACSPSPFVVKTIYTYANFTSIKISYMYILNQKIPPTPRRLGGHARQGTKSPSRGGARRYQKTYGKIY